MQYKEIEINGQKIAYYESKGRGTAVVMIHRFSGRCFQKQLESPLGEKYRIITIDLPGHGMSDKTLEPEKTYTLPGYAEVLVSFARELGLQKAAFVGWSVGGHIILEAADRLSASGLMVFGAPPISSLAEYQEACFPNPALSSIFNRELTDGEISAWVAACFRPGTNNIPDFLATDIKETDGREREILGVSAITGNFKNEVEVVGGLNIPIAIIQGEKDQITNPAYLRKLNIPTLWRGEIQIIPDAGHTPQWEQPEAFNLLLEEFIEEVVVSGRWSVASSF